MIKVAVLKSKFIYFLTKNKVHLICKIYLRNKIVCDITTQMFKVLNKFCRCLMDKILF
jgi:hypothetical protein